MQHVLNSFSNPQDKKTLLQSGRWYSWKTDSIYGMIVFIYVKTKQSVWCLHINN